ncbi:MAG: bifunctional (p)ppGpp synthetase/guanosine-3',5'-bis(diphosphate) 3'-pyrophosphohydrolase [Bacilli bacterium]|nr:bifunctional (p)ppGpp synthetase/guanosine-3',5'-bis(diphosphate) 3'-pyrophosphohydrolase [Bacilli bacterium]
MEDRLEQITIDDLIDKIKLYISNQDEIDVILKAYEFSKNKHAGQKRLDGNDFMIHPLNVALILTDLHVDYITLAASLMHEAILSGNTTLEEMKNAFGEEIAKLVNGITRINKISFSADSEYLINYYRKILVGLCEDVRVIFIKLADRLHNMRTLWAIPDAKRKGKAKETLEILAPIAHRLGIHSIKSDLEDLSLKYYKSDAYYEVVTSLNNTKLERDNAVKEMKLKIVEILNQNNIKCEIKGRSKSIYSIYTKMQNGHKFNEIYDILALRVYVEQEQECYLALGLIHSKFRPFPKRFKDYIAMPKENMYQSLHTTIFGVDGKLFEIQIRTYDMDQIAEYGIASHWSYKSNDNNDKHIKNFMEQKLSMFRSLVELNNEDINGEEFASNVKSEVLDDNIYLFTPKGDVIELPVGSTPVDFAYRVHTEVGEKMVGAIVNGNIVPLDYTLKDGDIVKININKNAKGPNKDWLNIATTAQAKSKIKIFFSKIDKDVNIKKGEGALIKELRKQKIPFSDFATPENINYLKEQLAAESIEDIYRMIGAAKFTASTIVNLIFKETKTKEELVIEKLTTNNAKNISNKNDVIVEGIDEIKVSLASCCTPIKEDNIIGYITKGKGITVHRIECHNINNMDERIVDVVWNPTIIKKWPTNIIVTAEKKDNLLLELISKTSPSNISIQKINTISNNDLIIYEMTVLVEDASKLDKFFIDVMQIPSVIKIERLIR